MDTRDYYSPQQIRAFQELLQQARRTRMMTQVQVAQKIGVSQTLISSLERGPSMGMRVGDLFKVLAYYGIDPAEISDVLGYTANAPRKDADPRVDRLLDLLDAVPDTVFDAILRALELMVRGGLEEAG